jgi:hypothetical protein
MRAMVSINRRAKLCNTTFKSATGCTAISGYIKRATEIFRR